LNCAIGLGSHPTSTNYWQASMQHFVFYELAGYRSPLTVTTDFAYVRLHGPGAGKYQGSYDETRLLRWRGQIEDWSRELKAVYVYFDNDQAGFAAQNALTLRKMIFGKELSR
jgi:uncharacterized protein YecE (DUF72 family)